ncbi:hypothetical protein C8R46DRAFT_1196794 [Mycena filopes]|nr:hypothetical protein C8R46DRAFT_1196794 [Mycena filopes]
MKTPAVLFFFSAIFAQALPRSSSNSSTPSFSSRVVYQSPTSLFLENIAVRSTSQLLLTSVAAPTLFTLDPTASNSTLTPVHTFPNATSLTGIAEYRPGVFALIASTTNSTTRRTSPGSISIWSIDLTVPASTRVLPARLIASLPSALSANGLTAMPHHPDILLAADSVAGAIWQVNTQSGGVRLAVQDASMAPGLPPPALGVNGVHARAGYLYFANSAKGSFARVKLAEHGGNITAAGAVETLATLGAGQSPDDFALDARGRAWVAVHPGALALVAPISEGNWTVETVVGNANGTDAGINQPTSAAFGRGDEVQEGILYVTTGVGQVVAVDVRG